MIGALLDTLDDKNQDVKQSVIESIERISRKNPEVVIHAAIYFWEMHKKVVILYLDSKFVVSRLLYCILINDFTV